VIAITAYTEPISSNAYESHPVHESHDDENGEKSSFAEILAGLLQNTQPAEINENIADLTAEFDVFAGADETNAALKLMTEPESRSDINFSDAAVKKENHANYYSPELMIPQDMASLAELDAESAKNHVLQSKQDSLPKDLSKASSAEKKTSDSAAQLTAETKTAVDLNPNKNINEDSFTSDKKKRAGNEKHSADTIVKNEKIQTFSAENRAGEENAALLNRRDENPGRLDEFRRMRRDRVSFDVRDLRTDAGMSANESQRTQFEASVSRVHGNASVQEVTLDLRLPDYSHASQAQTSWEARTGQTAAMENMLARELHQNFNGDIVRHASMILRNGGEGIIRIALHPETLGNVKIHLEMAENKITGVIFVESEEALNAFRREIAALEQAFKDSGFAEASLDLSFTADGAGTQEPEEGSFASQLAASSYEGSFDQETESVIDVFFGHKAGAVNLLA